MYHFTECGLNYVYLANGYNITHEDGEEFVSFDDLDMIQFSIADHICKQTIRMSGQQVKFIRKELDLSQSKFGEILFCDRQTVARWEKGEVALPKLPEAMIRALYLESVIDEDSSVFKILKAMSTMSFSEEPLFITLHQSVDGTYQVIKTREKPNFK